MSGKQRHVPNKTRRVGNRSHGASRGQASVWRSRRGLLGTKTANGVSLAARDSRRTGTKMEIGMNEAVDWISPLGFRDPKNELEAAIQRYADLYEFAPIAYLSLDRFGRIEESNPAAISLLERTRKQLLGTPFILRVVKEDSELFLRHLRRCRSSKSRVETELCLKNRRGDAIPVQLSSSPSTSSRKNRALLYQTAIIDLRERKTAEKSLADAARQHKALYEFVERRHEAQRSSDIYAAAPDAILAALLRARPSTLLFDGQGVMRFVAWRGLSGRYRRVVEGHSPWESDTKNPEPICISEDRKSVV